MIKGDLERIIEWKRTSELVSRVPFYLLVMVNILVTIAFFVMLGWMTWSSLEHSKDCVASVEYLIEVTE